MVDQPPNSRVEHWFGVRGWVSVTARQNWVSSLVGC